MHKVSLMFNALIILEPFSTLTLKSPLTSKQSHKTTDKKNRQINIGVLTMPVEKLSSQTSLPSININQDTDRQLKAKEYKFQLPLEKPSKEQLEKAVKGINDFIETSNTHIQFKLHEKLNEYYVTVVDNDTKEVVREIPSKKVLDVYAAMTEFIGLIVDKKI